MSIREHTLIINNRDLLLRILEWTDERGVTFYWSGNNEYTYTIVTDEETLTVIKLKFGVSDVR